MSSFLKNAVRVAFVGMLILTILVASMGLGIAAPDRDAGNVASGEWFPCRNHGCGCVSAEMCRNHCCCFKPEKPKPAPPTKPPRPCCATQEVEQTPKPKQPQEQNTDANDGVMMVIRSAACHGRDLTLVFVVPTWTFEASVRDMDMPPVIFQLSPYCPIFADLTTIDIDPPPPRCA